MFKIKFTNTYETIISLCNLLEAWREFERGKRQRKDVQLFKRNLITNIISLHQDLKQKSYTHGHYHSFNISDPKPRNIHKATVRDRLLHHAIYRQLYPFFDKTFISDSFSCRKFKGTHKALKRFQIFANKVSKNDTKTLWVLKCDVKRFFDSIDHQILLSILKEYVVDREIILLLERIISSFHKNRLGKGLPLGNLTSQLFVNIYLNKFDQFVKHKLKANYYVRYADDFVIMSGDKQWLEEVLSKTKEFLHTELRLELHPNKVKIQTLSSGVDFLGWVHFSKHRVLRTTTKKRMFRNIELKERKLEVVQAYLGLLSHGNGRRLRGEIKKWIKQDHSVS